ncbi:hypothetical protein [Micromonospora nigra]|uniref:hypothetical protein n=1 Tax=Micromonospora nigra TaxID=145857 RepID=UPI000B31C982|nr:hypothetical protein [Micromonospora nigra]
MTSPELTNQVARDGSRVEEASGRGPSRFRGDVAGLRAVAVGVVLFYHAGLSFLPGGFVTVISVGLGLDADFVSPGL